MDAAVARAGVLTWTETGSGPHGQTGTVTAAPQMWGDVVLARKEIPTSYHLAVTLDDAFQGVTDMVRGQDLFWSTSIHRLLQALLGLPEPVYHHHRLILDAEGHKLSKSTQAKSLRDLRAEAPARRISGAWSGLAASAWSRKKPPELVLFGPSPCHSEHGAWGPPWCEASSRKSPL